MSEDKMDKGWEFLNSDSDEDSIYDDDGSWGYKNSDGSGSYYGADGSWGYKNSDGSGSYYGNDGAWGYKNSDGSGAYYGSSDQDDQYYDADDDSDSSDGGWSDVLATAIEVAIGVGVAKHSIKREQERQEEAERQQEAERIRLIKEAERKANNALRKQRIKAFLFKGKKIGIPYDSEELIGENVDYVKDILTKGAFTKIKAVSVKDIYSGSDYSVGQVEKVVIGETDFFRAGDQFPYDSEIVITYHEKREIVVPFSESCLRKMNYIDAGDQLQNLGFTEIYERPIRDLVTGWVKKDGTVQKVTIGNRSFKKNSVFDYDTEIVIEYHTFKEK